MTGFPVAMMHYPTSGPVPPPSDGLIAWYDPSDITTLFQALDFTSPVTTDGQTVRSMLDKSPNANHLVGGLGTVTWDSDGFITYSAAELNKTLFAGLDSGTELTIFNVFLITRNSAVEYLYALMSGDQSANMAMENQRDNGAPEGYVYGGTYTMSNATLIENVLHISTQVIDLGESVIADRQKYYMNKKFIDNLTNPVSTLSPMTATIYLRMLSRTPNNSSLNSVGRWYQTLIYDRALDASEMADVNAYIQTNITGTISDIISAPTLITSMIATSGGTTYPAPLSSQALGSQYLQIFGKPGSFSSTFATPLGDVISATVPNATNTLNIIRLGSVLPETLIADLIIGAANQYAFAFLRVSGLTSAADTVASSTNSGATSVSIPGVTATKSGLLIRSFTTTTNSEHIQSLSMSGCTIIVNTLASDNDLRLIVATRFVTAGEEIVPSVVTFTFGNPGTAAGCGCTLY